jgi:hypothetical protein
MNKALPSFSLNFKVTHRARWERLSITLQGSRLPFILPASLPGFDEPNCRIIYKPQQCRAPHQKLHQPQQMVAVGISPYRGTNLLSTYHHRVSNSSQTGTASMETEI